MTAEAATLDRKSQIIASARRVLSDRRAAAVGSAVLCIIVFAAARFESVRPVFAGAFVAAALLAFAFDILWRQSGTAAEAFERSMHTLIDIMVALGIGFGLVYVIGRRSDTGAVFEPSEIPKAIGAAVAAFGLNLVSRGTGLIERMNHVTEAVSDSTKKLYDMTDVLRDSLAVPEYSLMAARALEVKLEWLNIESKPTAVVAQAITPGFEAIHAWLRSAQNDAVNAHQRNVWFRAMQTYFQEEVFDVSRYELATNVRNYAFVLLGAIDHYVREVAEGSKVVIVQVSPFAPKDFYNYPNGTKNNRFYHEAEYFGTYRRVLAAMVRQRDVLSYRMILAAPSSATFDSPRNLGWSLDPLNKMVLDTARYSFTPVPVTLPRASGATALTGFPESGDPFRRLPPGVRRVLWNPTFINKKNVEQAAHALFWSKSSDNGYADTVSRDGTSRLVRELWSDRARPVDMGSMKPAMRAHESEEAEAWDRVVAESVRPFNSLQEEARRCISESDDAGFVALRHALLEKSSADSPALLRHLAGLRRLSQLRSRLDPQSFAQYSQLLDWCQSLDASLNLIQHGTALHAEVSSTGIELGVVENWLHRILVLLEARRIEARGEFSTPIPLWRLMAGDFFGIDLPDKLASRSDLAALERRLAICTVGDNEEDESTSFTAMEQDGIAPEWIMLGYLPHGEDDIRKLSSRVLIRAEMSEPFHTCRIAFSFTGTDKYLNWFHLVHTQRSRTPQFLNQLWREIASCTD